MTNTKYLLVRNANFHSLLGKLESLSDVAGDYNCHFYLKSLLNESF